jgi:hypothetical protein
MGEQNESEKRIRVCRRRLTHLRSAKIAGAYLNFDWQHVGRRPDNLDEFRAWLVSSFKWHGFGHHVDSGQPAGF